MDLHHLSPAGLPAHRGSIPHPTRLLCTLRRGRHLPQRNTRYQAGATPYLDRTFTGWTAPASPGAPLFLHRSGLSPPTPCRSSRRTPYDSAQLGLLAHAPVIQRTAFQYGLWDGTDRIYAKDAPGDRNMMPDPNRLECFAEQF